MEQIIIFNKLLGHENAIAQISINAVGSEAAVIPLKDEHILIGDKEYIVLGILRDYDRRLVKVEVKAVTVYDEVMYNYHTV